jgi:hypothetical protein
VEDDLPPIDEAETIMDPEAPAPPTQAELVIKTGPKMGKNSDGDYQFGRDEIRKEIKNTVITGDKAYESDGHGKVLLQEKIEKNAQQDNREYYEQGYTGQQKETFGKDRAKDYDEERDVDVMGRKLAADYKEIKHGDIIRGPRKEIVNKEKKKKAKVLEIDGNKEYPERLALPSEKTPTKLTCVQCRKKITTNVDKKIDPMKFVVSQSTRF